ncbi:MAG: hypothetical protein WC526_01580 [Patescibacteria group bacterium]
MNIKNLFDLYYWFREPYTATGLTLWLLVGGFLFLIVTGLIIQIIAQYIKNKTSKVVLKKISTLEMTMGFLGLLWMFFRQERVAFLAWRFWLLIFAAVSVWWIYRIIWYAVKRAPEIKAEQEKKERIEKYLPGRG